MKQLHLRSIISFTLKIKDGIFLGDGRSPQLFDFLNNNKITSIVNCSGSEVITTYVPQTIKLLSIPWKDSDEEVILSPNNMDRLEAIYSLIEETNSKFQTVLICSLRGQSRSLTIITAYLMRKYRWSLYKTLEYLNSRRQDFEIRSNFLKQLVWYESILFGKKLKACTKDWSSKQLTDEGVIIRNTFLNSIFLQEQQFVPHKKKKNQKKVVTFQNFAVFINNKAENLKTQESQPDSIWKQEMMDLKNFIKKQIVKPENVKKHIRNSSHPKQSSPIQRRRQPTPYKISRDERLTDISPKKDIQLNINLNINSVNIISNQQPVLLNKLSQIEKSRPRRPSSTQKINPNYSIMMYLPNKTPANKKPISPYGRKVSLRSSSIERAESDRSRSFSINKKVPRKFRTLQK